MTRKIIVLRGIPGSGKTTYAKQWANEDSKHRVRFNRDDIRNMLGKYWVPSREDLINEMYETFLFSAMKQGYNIVVDNMNLNSKEIDFINNRVEATKSLIDYEYQIEFKDFFDVSLGECIKRDIKREHPIGASIIRKIYNRYKHLWK